MKPLLTLAALMALTTSATAAPIEWKDGDRVVFLGNTLIEREQRYGYWELALTRHLTQKNVTFRNLGWSGDTVWGEARAGFDTPTQGFRRLVELTLALKPTIIVLGYGSNESFAGESGIARFTQGYEKLLDALAPANARIVLLQPLRLEAKPAPLPDHTTTNRNLARYSESIRELGKKRGLPVVDLNGSLAPSPTPRTDNGMHLTAYGYWDSARALEAALTPAEKCQLQRVANEGLKFRARLPLLPLPPVDGQPSDAILSITGLPAGNHALKIDGKIVAEASAADWAKGVALTSGPDVAQAETLRQTILSKNELFFHQWRPQNITYLLGFRKHEQGNNAKELAQFDPLIAAKEADIRKLATPTEHEYELIQK